MTRPSNKSSNRPQPFRGLPRNVQTATLWIDESGSRGSRHEGLVIAGIKTRHPDDLLRSIHRVREKHGHCADEFKFTRVDGSNEHRYRDLVDLLSDSDVQIHALVVDARIWNPFKGGQHWSVQAAMLSRLVVSAINHFEVMSVYMDGITTPDNTSLGQLVKRKSNYEIGGGKVVSAVSLNSKTNDLLQLADLTAGAIRRARFEPESMGDDPKSRIALRLAAGFGAHSFEDQSQTRFRVKTAEPARGLT